MASKPIFGLNRFNFTTAQAFAQDVSRAEALGWGAAFIPSSPLLLQDPYVFLAQAAQQTETILLGPLLENPVIRHPAVIASSMATLEGMAPHRALLAYGVGDTAVRLIGKRPAKVKELEDATVFTRQLLLGEDVEVGALRPAKLRHAKSVPIWLAAGGPRTLRMAGRVADGVFIRVGRHEENLKTAIEAVKAGAQDVGRNPDEVKIAIILHTILTDDAEAAALMSKSMAAGYYEYTPALFDPPGFHWNGPDVHELKKQVWPDFHHAADLQASGRLVSFLSDEIAEAFALYGPPEQIAEQINRVLACGQQIDMVVPHPVPAPVPQGPSPDYIERFAKEVMPRVI
ncbi:MAG: LLM class flavin-dependent oxidoreductase [Pseudomonadota bacterium]